MEKTRKIFKISELIASDLGGNISDSDKKLLNDWLNDSDENVRIYNKIKDTGNFAERNNLYEKIDVTRAWSEVSKTLVIQKQKHLYRSIVRYAAAILIPAFLGISVYWFINRQQPEIATEMVQITPGSSNAVLVMANGANIDLANDSIVKLQENDGTIINNSNEQLSYVDQPEKVTHKQIYNTLIVPRGGEYSLVLSDGTKVFLNSMSKLVFPVSFTGSKREVTLEGEAYFEVAKDKSKPFIVSFKGTEVEVLGTSFNIKAYADDKQSYTTLVEGKVKLNPANPDSKGYFLEPNQQAVFDPVTSETTVQEVDAAQVVQWITGRYTFSNMTLDEIMKTLSRWYDFSYQYGDESLKDLRFEGGLNKYESIDPILEIIKKTRKVKVVVTGKKVLFSKI